VYVNMYSGIGEQDRYFFYRLGIKVWLISYFFNIFGNKISNSQFGAAIIIFSYYSSSTTFFVSWGRGGGTKL